jgi:hypothetical protein
MKSTKLNLTIVVVMMLMAIVMFAIVFSLQTTTAYATTADVCEFEQYTSRTSFMCNNGGSFTLQNYLDDFNSLSSRSFRGEISGSNNLFLNNSVVNEGSTISGVPFDIFGDNNIVNIIPRKLLTQPTEMLYLGTQYGFYINTRNVTASNRTFLMSTVILIDVTVPQNSKDYVVHGVKIKPLISLDFVYATNGTMATTKNFSTETFSSIGWARYALVNGGSAVVPTVRIEADTQTVFGNSSTTYRRRFKESHDFTLSDISFSASLRNNNALNFGDAGYNPHNDNGYFFIGNSYNYRASMFQDGTITKAPIDRVEHFADAFLGVMSYLDPTGLIGGNVSGVIDIAKNIFYASTGFSPIVRTGISYNSTSNENLFWCNRYLPNTRLSQLGTYHHLIKASAIMLNTDGALLFRSGDYAQGIFQISHSDQANWQKEYTRFDLQVSLKVINNASGETEHVDSTTFSHNINQPTTTPVEMFSDNNYYIQPRGEQSFRLVALHSSLYDFNLNNDNIAVYIDDVPLVAQGGKRQIVFAAHTPYLITLKNTSGALQHGTFNVDFAVWNGGEINIPSNLTRFTIRFKPTADRAVNVTTSQNAVIDNIFTLNAHNQFATIFGYNYMPENYVSAFLTGGTDYYISLNRISGTAPIVLQLNDLQQIGIGATSAVVNRNRNYYKFVVPYDASFAFTFDFPNTATAFGMIDSDFRPIATINSSMTMEAHDLQRGEVVYVSVRDLYFGKRSDGEIRINDFENAFKWKINGRFINGQRIDFEMNTVHEIEFWVNDVVQVTDFTDFGIDRTLISINRTQLVVNGKPTLSNCGRPDIQLFARSNVLTREFFGYPLNIYFTYENKVQLSGAVNNNDTLGFNWRRDVNEITALQYELSFDNGEIIRDDSTWININATTGSANLLNQINRRVAETSIFTVRIVAYKINGVENPFYGNPTAPTTTLTASTRFASGTGASNNAFIIRYPRHFNNIRHSSKQGTNYLYHQTQRLDFGNTAPAAVDFWGTYVTTFAIVANFTSSATQVGLFRTNHGNITIGNLHNNITIRSTHNNAFVGGVAAVNHGTITVTLHRVNIEANNFNGITGGIAGDNRATGTIHLLGDLSGTIRAKGDIGGIAGRNAGAINGLGVERSGEILRGHVAVNITYFYHREGSGTKAIGGAVGRNLSTGRVSHIEVHSRIEFGGEASNDRFHGVRSSYMRLQPRMGALVGENSGTLTNNGTINARIPNLINNNGMFGGFLLDQMRYVGGTVGRNF